MTREEKISHLKDILSEINENDDAVCYLTSEDNELIESAIEALEQQPCEDAISRQAAIDIVQYECGEWKGLAKEIVKQFNDLPPVQPKYNTDEWCKTCKEYNHEKHCCSRYNKVIRNAVEEMKQEAYEDAIAVREFGLDDFIEFGKKAFGVELTFKKSNDPDTYEKLFGTSQQAKNRTLDTC